MRLPSKRWIAGGVAVLVVGAAAIVAAVTLRGPPPPPRCSVPRIDGSGKAYSFDPEQTQDASIVAALGYRLGLPDHAVTIALAAALAETQLRNLNHGDLDSLGLFQQRPSQGWGSPAQVMDPAHATVAFYQHLVKVPRWASMPVTEAAQLVQHSATPTAYALWESRGRSLAQAFTGEIPAGLACALRFFEGPPPRPETLMQIATLQFGSKVLGNDLSSNVGWRVATWTVGHAYRYHVESVTFDGRMWTRRSGRWQHAAVSRTVVEVTQCFVRSCKAT